MILEHESYCIEALDAWVAGGKTGHVTTTEKPTVTRTGASHRGAGRTLSTLWTSVRDELALRRAERASRRALERDLAAYTTPAERAELLAVMSRYEPADTAEMDRIIHRRRVA